MPKPRLRSGPKRPGAVLIQRRNHSAQSAVLALALYIALLYCAQPAKWTPQRADPNRTFMILKQRCHELLIKLWVPSQLAATPTDEAGVCANPKSPVAGDEQLGDSIAGETLTRGRMPGI